MAEPGSDGVSVAKQQLRQRLRQTRRGLEQVEVRTQVLATVARCLELAARLKAPAVASYLATADELDLDQFHQRLWRDGRVVYMPRVLGGGRLDWHPLRSDHQCHPGAFGLREPDPDKVPGGPLPSGALLLVPGLGFTADGRRLGQGGGFYDRALAGFTGVAVGIGYDCQRCDDLPTQAHDRRLDGMILGGVLVLDPKA